MKGKISDMTKESRPEMIKRIDETRELSQKTRSIFAEKRQSSLDSWTRDQHRYLASEKTLSASFDSACAFFLINLANR